MRRPRMCGFLGSEVPFVDVIIPQESGGPPCEPQAGFPFLQTKAKLLQNVDSFPRKKEEPPARRLRRDCEDLILGREIIYLQNCNEEREGETGGKTGGEREEIVLTCIKGSPIVNLRILPVQKLECWSRAAPARFL